MVSAQTFYGEYLALIQQFSRASNNKMLAAYDLITFLQVIARTARRASHWMSVEAPVGGIVIFGGAINVKRPLLHRGVWTVVRKSSNHRVARAAIGAIDVRIKIARVSGLKQFRQTLFANR